MIAQGTEEHDATDERPELHAALNPLHDDTRVPSVHSPPSDADSHRHSVSVWQQTSPSHVADWPPIEPQEHEFREP